MGGDLSRFLYITLVIGGMMLIMAPLAMVMARIEAREIHRRSRQALDKYLALWDCINTLRKLSFRDAATALDERRYTQLLDRYWEQMVDAHRDIVEQKTTGRAP